jgi:peptide/nickel transport system permease protein
LVAYIIRRLLFSLFVLFALSVAIFLLVQFAADPLTQLRQNPQIRGEDIDRLTAIYGLDQPLVVQYGIWMRDMIFYGDFGLSFRQNIPVTNIIAIRVWPTVQLLGSAIILSIAIGIPLGIYSAIRKYSALDKTVTFFSFVFFSTPVFLLGLILQLVFAIRLTEWTGIRFFYVSGMSTEGFVDWLQHITLPAFTLAVTSIAVYSRFQRSAMLDVLTADYLRTARAKGLSNRAVYLKHALRNALIPIVTLVALDLISLIAGAVVTETVFSWPGLGFQLLNSIYTGDYNVARAILMIIAVITVLLNLIADIAYSLVDPRVSYS